MPEVCQAIWDVLAPNYMAQPDMQDWLNIANRFEQLWQFPNCLGAIDGKHIRIQCPPNAGSEFFNYKKYHSIVLQAVVDAEGNFITIDVGDYGRTGDSGVFGESNFGKKLTAGELNLPPERQICENNNYKFPYVMVGDEAYPLRKYLMKPFPRKNLTKETRIFNYRLSRARRLVECAFGMITKRFRVLEKIMLLSPDKAGIVTMAACILHNFIRKKEGTITDICNELGEFCIPISSVNDNEATSRSTNIRSTSIALTVRKEFLKYFNSKEGSVAWQDKYI